MRINENNLSHACVVGLNTHYEAYTQDSNSLDELSLLAKTAGLKPCIKLLQRRSRIDPTYYIGYGKAREIRKIVVENDIDTVIFDFEPSPVQVRNLEHLIRRRIVSRTELILDIFEKRAHTKEAKLQVELATLIYALPRLRHMWPHLHRTAGGIGTRGPGEKQLETDRRRISKRISTIKQQLVSVKTHRMVVRSNRRYKNRVSLVGYTNAGKSSLLNLLAHASLFTENRLFATLDPATRLVWLGENTSVLITDTVGFIKRLPHSLIASFRSTLEEVKDSNLLIHVVDISSNDTKEQIAAVNEVLREIDAHNLPILYVFNKADLLPQRDSKASLLYKYTNSVLVSAKSGEGIDQLKERLRLFFTRENEKIKYLFPERYSQLLTAGSYSELVQRQ